MTTAKTEVHGQRTCRVEVSPSEVDAGAAITIRVVVTCPHGCDLTGDTVLIRNDAGEKLVEEELFEAEGGAYQTSNIEIEAPHRVGAYVFCAVLPELDEEGLFHDEVVTDFAVTVKAHTAHLSVWGMPAAIPAGGRFRFKVSMKCSTACVLAGREMEIVDSNDEKVGTVALGESVWPGTEALYYGEFESDAPSESGEHKWSIRTAAIDTGLAHQGASLTFGFRVVPNADFEVVVEAIDGENNKPIKGMHVLMHPYRGVTNQNGIARIEVAKGAYMLRVSGFNYIAYQAEIDAESDIVKRVELRAQPVDEEARLRTH